MTRHWSLDVETGAVLELVHVRSRLRLRALVETKSDATQAVVLSLCHLERPYEKLRVALNKQVGWATAAAKFAAFQVEDASTEEMESVYDDISRQDVVCVHFKAVAHQKKLNREDTLGWYLGVSNEVSETSQQYELIGDAARGTDSLFSLAIVSKRGAFALNSERTLFHGAFRTDPSTILTESQRQAFIRDGYLQIRGVVPIKLVNAALRRINHELGIPGRMVDGGVEGAGKLAGNISNSEEVLNLFHLSDARAYAEALVGLDKVVPPRGAQIAMRFPELGEPRDPQGTEWHTDGMRQGKLHPFTLLVGITLSDVREPLAGNFTVFPGSHLSLHKLLRTDGKLEGYEDECYRADSVWGDGTLPDLGVPVQLLASRGDIVLAHPNLAHRGGLNFSPDIRYQVYFRLKHVDHEQLQVDAAKNLWVDLEGLHGHTE
ncbi:hypothetical protein Poli38472_002401 [Pythium oligandrum]|uniref:Phytanoyl-CoA dioxygenase n=1 Tax=Pythium oligandrum TaxID=41045 RepID=A0A8K1CHR8_PYTOL|nr:hypothetical protein Poli38472_002401 [Pythium oligandrum]|eukprot:TMW63460.1 hypothetical protein Poli38472_002401 [Pythium oligandrum]